MFGGGSKPVEKADPIATPIVPTSPTSPIRANPALSFFNFVGSKRSAKPEFSNDFKVGEVTPGRKPGTAKRALIGGDAA